MVGRTMVRTQVQLTEEQSRTLKTLAAERGVSVAELIRQSVDNFIKTSTGVSTAERRRRAIAAIGRYDSGRSDISDHHDEYLVEAYGS
jgi:deoxyribose-phosphate aldolase